MIRRSITTLELGYNPMGPDGAKELADVIKFFGNVETLRLGWCKLGVKGEEPPCRHVFLL